MLRYLRSEPVTLTLLIVYGAPLVVVGLLRLFQLSGLQIALPELERVLSGNLVPFIAHIVGVIGFNLLGALQFSATLRLRRPHVHRNIGWLAVVSGMTVAFSGLWLSLFFPVSDTTTPTFTFFRIVASVVLATFLYLGLLTAIARQFHAHRNWMIRAYALSMGTTTQGLLFVLWESALGPLPQIVNAYVFAVGWTLTLAFAEFFFVTHKGRSPQSKGISNG